MERFPRSLVEALHRIMHGRGTRAVGDTVTAITARAFERFEPRLDVQREWREARKAQARGIRLLKESHPEMLLLMLTVFQQIGIWFVMA